MITVPPSTDNPGTPGNGRVMAIAPIVPIVHSPGAVRPYVAAIAAVPHDVAAADIVIGDPVADQIATGTASEAVPGAEPETVARPAIRAGDAKPGVLLSHMVQGENVGLEIRHVEPYTNGTGVTIVMAGGHTEYLAVDDLLEVVDPAEAAAAAARLAAKQRTAGQVDVLRHIAALAEGGELPVPFHLRVEGDLPTLDLLHAAADVLGATVVEGSAGYWRVECRFGADDKYTAPVELSLTHYASSYGRGQS